MTIYEAFNLVAQFSLVLVATVSFLMTIVVYLHKKK